MKPRIKKRVPTRVAALASFAAVGFVSLLVACDVELPTAAEVARMNVASAEAEMKKLPVFNKGEGEVFIVDGVAVSAAQAHAVAADQIASIDIIGAKVPGEKAEIRITRLPASDVRAKMHAIVQKKTAGIIGTKAQLIHDAVASKLHGALAVTHQSKPIMVLNGVRVAPADIHALSSADIASVEIVKGAVATRRYGTPDAANGVISVTTRKSGGLNTP